VGVDFTKPNQNIETNDKMITKDTKQWILIHTNDKMITKDTKQWILMHTSDKIVTKDTKMDIDATVEEKPFSDQLR
jgi:hypothetical protein